MNKHDVNNIKSRYKQFRFKLKHGEYDTYLAYIVISSIYVLSIVFALWMSKR